MFCLSGLLSFSGWTFFRASAFMDTQRCLRLVLCISLQKMWNMLQLQPSISSHFIKNAHQDLYPYSAYSYFPGQFLYLLSFLVVKIRGWRNQDERSKGMWEFSSPWRLPVYFNREDWQSLEHKWEIKPCSLISDLAWHCFISLGWLQFLFSAEWNSFSRKWHLFSY